MDVAHDVIKKIAPISRLNLIKVVIFTWSIIDIDLQQIIESNVYLFQL